eukprot:XP_011662295.1 PREDICTED: DNA-directed RNA polymerase I subunit RPA34 [Strongylocentrotus purpuratus]
MTRIERFTTPPSFEEVDLSEGECPLDLKDVSKSRKELWLIRAPLGFDGSSLNGVTLDLDGDSVEFSCEEGAGKKYEAMSVRQLKENEGQSPYLLLPSQEERNLEPGPAFKGQVVIMESLSLPPSSSQSLPEMKQSEAPKMPEGLRQRFKPFGCEKPWQGEDKPSPSSQPKKSSSSRMKRKIKEENTPNDEVLDHVTRVTGLETVDGRIVDEEGEPEPESKKKMKKAKRKHIKEEVAEEESRPEHTDDVVDEGGSSPRRKKKKKKSKDK